MSKVTLLCRLKQKILYRLLSTKIIVCLLFLLIVGFMTGYWYQKSNDITIYIVDEDHSPLSTAFLNAKSERIKIIKTTSKEGMEGVRNYRAEMMIVIPQGASQAISAGNNNKVFKLYYLQGNQLARYLADRMISDVFSEIYQLSGIRSLEKLYQKYEMKDLLNGKKRLEEEIAEIRKQMSSGSYFTISLSEAENVKESDSRESRFRENKGKLTELGILFTVSGINFTFLMYFGLKLLSERQKDDKIRLAGFQAWHFIASDAWILFVPQCVLFAVLLVPAVLFQGISLWISFCLIGLISIAFLLILIRRIKEKRYYFPLGISMFMFGTIAAIAFVWNR